MKVLANASLKNYNSFQFDVTAEELVIVESDEEISYAFDTDKAITVLGGGTNVVMKRFISGRVVHLTLADLKVEMHDHGSYLVYAESGRNWNDLVRYTLGLGISGLENLTLIPGSVGGAPFQNIGAYGVELSDVLESVLVFDRMRHTKRTLKACDCGFGYRDSVFKSADRNRYVILGVSLRLGNKPLVTSYKDVRMNLACRSSDHFNATLISEVVASVRRRKLPDTKRIGNVGSFFKNPVISENDFDVLRGRLEIDGSCVENGIKVSAARLIDRAGWKGVNYGRSQVWPRQPLVIINRGGSSGKEVLELANEIGKDVQEKFAVELEVEPEILGDG